MDRCDWLTRVRTDAAWAPWATYLEAADRLDRGRRTSWVLNLLDEICRSAGCAGRPECLPHDARALRALLEPILARLSHQLQSKALSLLRRVLAAETACAPLLAVLPRYRRAERVDRIARQRQMVVDDALPKRNLTPWLVDLFREIVDHPTSNWKTSKSANQSLHLIHKFLRATGLLSSCESRCRAPGLTTTGQRPAPARIFIGGSDRYRFRNWRHVRAVSPQSLVVGGCPPCDAGTIWTPSAEPVQVCAGIWW